MSRSLVVALAMLCAGCGDSLSSPTVDVTGPWSLAMQNVSGGSGGDIEPCTTDASTALSLSQSGNTITGQYVGGQLTCPRASGPPVIISINTGTVANGQISGNAVTFDLSAINLHFNGTATTTQMTGSLSGSVAGLDLNGNWTATSDAGGVASRR